MARVVLEVCVDDAAGLAAAVAGGADRIELCSALVLGGLTPSTGLMQLAAQASVPVYAMIRPRAGDFVYSAPEIDIMRRDIDAARSHGLAGVVIGASNRDGSLNSPHLQSLMQHAHGLGLTLHRAFDLVSDFHAAIDLAIALGFERILSSGGPRTALEGLAKLSDYSAYAAGRIIIMPGGGIDAATALTLLQSLPLQEIHASCSSPSPQSDARLLELGFSAAGSRSTDRAKVEALRNSIDRAAL